VISSYSRVGTIIIEFVPIDDDDCTIPRYSVNNSNNTVVLKTKTIAAGATRRGRRSRGRATVWERSE